VRESFANAASHHSPGLAGRPPLKKAHPAG
jgi:hypothetical protein